MWRFAVIFSGSLLIVHADPINSSVEMPLLIISSQGVLAVAGETSSVKPTVPDESACSCNVNDTWLHARDDYTYTSNVGAHKLHLHLLNWNAARKVCNEEGGHLAVIDSAAEEQVLYAMINEAGLQKKLRSPIIFLGYHDLFEEGDWVTILGKPITAGYINWSNAWGGQPDNAWGGQNCAGLRSTGLDDVWCGGWRHFICELPITK